MISILIICGQGTEQMASFACEVSRSLQCRYVDIAAVPGIVSPRLRSRLGQISTSPLTTLRSLRCHRWLHIQWRGSGGNQQTLKLEPEPGKMNLLGECPSNLLCQSRHASDVWRSSCNENTFIDNLFTANNTLALLALAHSSGVLLEIRQ